MPVLRWVPVCSSYVAYPLCYGDSDVCQLFSQNVQVALVIKTAPSSAGFPAFAGQGFDGWKGEIQRYEYFILRP
jgi:hypothetical protein